MPTKNRRTKVLEEVSEEEEEFADSLQSDGNVVSELPARYRRTQSSKSSFIGPLVLFLAVVVGGYIGYDYFSRTTSSPAGNEQQTNTTENANTSPGEAFPVATETLTPSGDVPVEMDVPPVVVETPLTIEVRNGTATAGLAKKIGDKVTATNSYTVQKVGNASKNTFAKTIVVVVGQGTLSGRATALAELLNAEVVLELPVGEVTSMSDVVVIVGQDQVTAQ